MRALARVVLATGMLLSVAPARLRPTTQITRYASRPMAGTATPRSPMHHLTRISWVQVPTEPGASPPTDLTRQTASIALTAQSGRHPHH
jgi:hypothetical protein